MPGYGDLGYGFGLYGGLYGTDGVRVVLDDGTGTFPYDITSKVLIGPGIALSRGRQDWQGGVTAGAMSLTLNNADGRFTPGSTFYGSPSPIKVDQRIRVIDTVDGTAYVRFTGYVKSWPVAWPATVSTWSTVQIVATDAQARAERRVLRHMLIEELAQDAAVKYVYELSEVASADAAGDTSGNQGPTFARTGTGSPLVFGGTTPTYALAGVTFAGGEYLKQSLPTQTAPLGVALVFNRGSAPATTEALLTSDRAGTLRIVMNSSGQISFPGLGITTTASYADGVDHLVEFWNSLGTWVVRIDGQAVLPDTVAANEVDSTIYSVGGGGAYTTFSGMISTVFFLSATYSGTRAVAHASALAGFPGESDSTRLTRLAGYAGLTVGTFDSSLTNLAGVSVAGRTAWETLQEVADASFGVPFINSSGTLDFHNRNRVATKTTPDLTLMASYVTPDVQPVTDDQQIVNYLDVVTGGSGASQLARSTTSEASHGRYSGQVSYIVQTDSEALDRANWIIANFAEPTTRYGTLSINLFAMSPTQASAVLAAVEIDCWLRVVAMPSQNTTGATADVVVEGYAEEITANSWKLTCNVVSKSLTDALVLDDPTRGVLDAGNRLYV